MYVVIRTEGRNIERDRTVEYPRQNEIFAVLSFRKIIAEVFCIVMHNIISPYIFSSNYTFSYAYLLRSPNSFLYAVLTNEYMPVLNANLLSEASGLTLNIITL